MKPYTIRIPKNGNYAFQRREDYDLGINCGWTYWKEYLLKGDQVEVDLPVVLCEIWEGGFLGKPIFTPACNSVEFILEAAEEPQKESL